MFDKKSEYALNKHDQDTPERRSGIWMIFTSIC